MKRVLFIGLLVASVTTLQAQLIDAGQLNFGVSHFTGTGVTDIQSGKENNGSSTEFFGRLRLGFIYTKLSYESGSFSQKKNDQFYHNTFRTRSLRVGGLPTIPVKVELGLQTSPDFITFGDMGVWLQGGFSYQAIGVVVENHLINTNQQLVNTGAMTGVTIGGGIEWDGMLDVGEFEISPTLTIEYNRNQMMHDDTWDGIEAGLKNDHFQGWRILLSFRFGSW